MCLPSAPVLGWSSEPGLLEHVGYEADESAQPLEARVAKRDVLRVEERTRSVRQDRRGEQQGPWIRFGVETSSGVEHCKMP